MQGDLSAIKAGCLGCGAETGPWYSPDDKGRAAAITAWNTRAADHAPTLLEALEEAAQWIGEQDHTDEGEALLARLKSAITQARGQANG